MNQLPVSAEQITAPYIEGLPNNMPFQPQLNLPPDLQPYVTTAAGFLIKELQDQAQKNPLRVFLINQLAQNNYQNEEFSTILMSVMEYAEFLTATQNLNPQQAIIRAVQEICSMMASINTQIFPPLQQYVQDQTTFQSVQQWIQRFSQLGQQLDQWKASQSAPMQQQWGAPQQGWGSPQQGWGNQQQQWGQPAQQAGWGPQRSWGAPPMQQQQGWGVQHGGRGYGPSPNQMAMRTPMTQPVQPQTPHRQGVWGGTGPQHGQWNQPPSQPKTGSALRANRGQPQQAEPTSFSSGGPGQKAEFGFSDGTAQTITEKQEWPPASSQWSQPEEKPMTQQAQDAPQVEEAPERLWDDYVAEDGSRYRPAFKSTWEVTRDMDTAHTPAYDPRKEILFHRMTADGTVTEVLMDINDENEYLLYELDPSFARKVKLERAPDAGLVDWDKVGKAKSKDEVARERNERLQQLKDEGELDEDATVNDLPPMDSPTLVLPVMTVSSQEEASLGCMLDAMRNLDEVPDDLPLEYLYYRAIPFVGDGDFSDKIKRLHRAPAFIEAVTALKGLKDELPSRIWYQMHDAITNHVNEILHAVLRLDVSITSFVDDALELVKDIREHDGPAYAELLESMTQDIIMANTKIMEGDQRREYLEKLNFAVEDPTVIDNILVFGELNSITEVPWLAADLPVQLDSDVCMVLESRHPNLHKALDKIVTRAKRVKRDAFRNHIVVTADNVRLKIYESALSKGQYLISRA